MKKPRWRKILKVMKPHAIKLMDMHNHQEWVSAVSYQSYLSEKEEMAVLTTLHDYANLVDRSACDFPRKINNIWLFDLMNYQD